MPDDENGESLLKYGDPLTAAVATLQAQHRELRRRVSDLEKNKVDLVRYKSVEKLVLGTALIVLIASLQTAIRVVSNIAVTAPVEVRRP